MAYGSRQAASIFSCGGSVNDVYARLGSTGLWSARSQSIERYVDTRVRRFFENDNPLTWRQFKELSPEVMHDLSTDLHPVQRCESPWFGHDQRSLLQNSEKYYPLPGIEILKNIYSNFTHYLKLEF